MQSKTNWPEAREHWTALWEGRCLGRPCITVTAPNGVHVDMPVPVSGEQLWLDPDFIVRSALAQFASTYYGGESFPSVLKMAGWGANAYGAIPHFPMDTIWFEPIAVDWDNPPSLDLDWDSPWFRKVVAIHKALLKAAGRDNFVVGSACCMPPTDMLAFVLGPETLLAAMCEHREWVRQAILKLTHNWVAMMRYFGKLAALGIKGVSPRILVFSS